MILYIFVAVVTVLLGFLINNHCERQLSGISRQKMLNGLSMISIFLLLFGVSACRLNVGNDYAKYVEFMHLINCDAFVPTEFGFNWIVKLLYEISGFENYLLVFAFSCRYIQTGRFLWLLFFPVYGIRILFSVL